MSFVGKINRIILGLVFLVPGLYKLISVSPADFAVAFAFLPLPIFFSWAWILAEIIIGLMVLFSIMPRFSSTIAALMMLSIVGFTQVEWTNILGMSGGTWTTVLIHLVAATNFLLVGRASVLKRRHMARRRQEMRKQKEIMAKGEEEKKKILDAEKKMIEVEEARKAEEEKANKTKKESGKKAKKKK